MYVAGLDSEDDGAGNPFLWAIVHERGTWSGTSREAVLRYIEALALRCKTAKQKLEVWCTNLEYDLVNVFDPDRVHEVSFRFGRHALCGARWRGAEFRDTLRHLPISVAAFGELVGLKKLESKLFAPGSKRSFEAFKRRCLRDAAITFRAAKFFHKTYGALGVRPRMTLASTALNLWREKYWQREVRRPEEEVWQAALSAYHGGRTQAFAVGTFRDVHVIDAASMFPWAMTAGDLPLPWGLYRAVVPGEEVSALGLYRVRVESRLAFPMLPVRTDQGTMYPNGTWRAWYTGEELQAFLRYGGKVRVLSGYVFTETCRPFDEYVSRMFARKQKARGARRLLFKTLLNGLYGKFSQQGKRVHAIPLEDLLTMEKPPLDWRAWNGLAIFSEDHEAPPWSNHLWPAIVTARARARLADAAAHVRSKGGRVLYCDTDSLMYVGGPTFPKEARAIGDFEHRGTFRQALIVGKKEYALEVKRGRWECHVKGVPAGERERYLREGVADFSRPVRIRESTRTGETANVWRTVRKVRRKNVRSRRPDGSLPVPLIRE